MLKNIDTIIQDSVRKKDLLKSVKLNDKIFEKFINSSLTKVEYIYLSSNSTLNQEQIRSLFLKNVDNVNINLLRHSLCPKDKIKEFIKLNDKIYNIAIAHNKSLDQSIIRKLANLNDTDVTISLKFNNLL